MDKKINNDLGNNSKLTDDELWAKSGMNIPITRSDIGLKQNDNQNGLQVLNEGFDSLQFNYKNKE